MSLAPLLNAAPAVQLHTAAALVAAVSGAFVMVRTKGTASHLAGGYVFSIAIVLTAITSFWITRLTPGHSSWIHILSVVTLVSIPMAIYYRRAGNIRRHAANMIAPFVSLIVAGAFTFAPGRIMHNVLFGP